MFSALLLGISIWIRMTLHESPVFQRLRDRGTRSTSPFRDAFARPDNLKLVLIALFSMMVAQGALWYTAFFYAQTFVEKIVKVAPGIVNTVMIAVVVCSAPLYVFFGGCRTRLAERSSWSAG